ncbi:hypothetical protein [Lyngbya sp. PCC 8106]|uniref:hypothetical protein n=1 Tax=Lyngbya sp. (strain PCC 8106) TaxID=313612 RepID=UPI0000EAB1C2|nr:hypothetical protein [Lyngbya sp. PCC 8106]EAW35775.1 8-amino-7-oxononanoate synthase [Lyngbya sp. PCC 8106]
MGIERRLFRGMFDAGEVVELRQTCFTPSRVYEPGKYIAGELPDIAFDMGLVEKLPTVRDNSAEIRDPE